MDTGYFMSVIVKGIIEGRSDDSFRGFSGYFFDGMYFIRRNFFFQTDIEVLGVFSEGYKINIVILCFDTFK